MNSADNILSDQQIQELAAIRNDCDRGVALIERINQRALKTGMDLRQIPDYPLRLVTNDISQLMCAHMDAEQELRDKAMERLKATT